MSEPPTYRLKRLEALILALMMKCTKEFSGAMY